eukprot:Rmarinus@m.15278
MEMVVEKLEKLDSERRPKVQTRSIGVMCDIIPSDAVNAPGGGNSKLGGATKTPTKLEFDNLTYKVFVKDEDGNEIERVLLTNVSGSANPGEVLAIVGPSGAGKSTLLDCLAGRIKESHIEGSLRVNGRSMVVSMFRRQSGYVMQSDFLFPLLTVKETLFYSARLRTTLSDYQIEIRVRQLLQELVLTKVADSAIGDTHEGGLRGISGGERRRVSIAVDMVHDPNVLFLDEPTSGLDSTSAMHVVRALNTMAEQGGRSIILTIHQPSTRIMDLIHKVLVLANGHVVYWGSFDNLVPHFKPLAQEESNVRMTTLEYALDTIEQYLRAKDLDAVVRHFQQSRGLKQARDRRKNRDEAPVIDIHDISGLDVSDFANEPKDEVLILFKRAFTNTIRTKELFVARTALTFIIGFSVSTVFYQVDNDYEGIVERMAFFVYTIMALSYTMIDALPIFLHERDIFVRETSRGAYRPASYVIAYSLVFIPFILLQSVVFVLSCWWMVGLEGGVGEFFFYILLMWATFLQANALVMFLSGVTPDFLVGNTIYGALIPLMFLFSGFFLPKDDLPVFWLPFHYLSIIKYPFEACMLNEFGGDVYFDCPVRNGVAVEGCYLTGDDVLDPYDLKGASKWGRFFITIAFGLVYRFLFYRALTRRAQSTRD